MQNLRQLFDDWLLEVKKDLAKRGNFWNPTLVTLPAEARTVVLRNLDSSFDSASKLPCFVIHTDIRSQKWGQLRREPACSLHFYCTERKWQMRLDCVARLCSQDDYAQSQWQQLSPRSKRIYALKHQPGSAVKDPQIAYCFEADDKAYDNFGVLVLQATNLESLQLEQPDRTDYHVRAVWNLESDEYSYLAP
ncbi:MAG: pyridoxamine 5'-phosphate oxidase family protein [Pseudomonadales bacterium]|nr:pyridoxamine 5'-phosphate oxidase family protein [Pseudomonadales bacterium]